MSCQWQMHYNSDNTDLFTYLADPGVFAVKDGHFANGTLTRTKPRRLPGSSCVKWQSPAQDRPPQERPVPHAILHPFRTNPQSLLPFMD
ncbi:hypothetical protein EDB19DRAFT_473535 [Suillus lakei]|nr:hypothetical protein EDB19DRAFT_473535 [Suillus lakei]